MAETTIIKTRGENGHISTLNSLSHISHSSACIMAIIDVLF